MNSKQYFIDTITNKFNENKKISPGNITYGENVLPILEIYSNLSKFEEKESYRDALNDLFISDDEDLRKYTISICIGFLVFRDSL